MAKVDPVEREFSARLEYIRTHGLGLSVDVYSPDLISLLGALRQRQVAPGYLEIFRVAQGVLASLSKQIGPDILMTYHGEGLWLTLPDSVDNPVYAREIREVAGHLRTLKSAWLTHECATKYIAGYAYGTYLPPLYTEPSAAVVAENVMLMQEILDRHCQFDGGGTPLVLLEMPPLTYFVAGTLAIPAFFRLVTQHVACGLVLDVGHLWTVFRYSGAWRSASLEQFVNAFLDEFPLNRVVQIHVAGLAVHESSAARFARFDDMEAEGVPTAWIDAHAAPIPSVLFDMLDQILSHPGLISLRGLALEVDTKPIPLIVEEFAAFSERYASVFSELKIGGTVVPEAQFQRVPNIRVSTPIRQELAAAYKRYASVLTGRAEPQGPEWDQPAGCADEIETYRSAYLPYEILSWGGEVEAMFPETCRRLDEQGVPLDRFVAFWFSRPRVMEGPYDFFLVKITRFVEFIREEVPELAGLAEHEADDLRRAYDLANQIPAPAVGRPA